MQPAKNDNLLYQGNEIAFVLREERGYLKPLFLYPQAVGIVPAQVINGEIYITVLEQFRIGSGALSLEVPAGKMKEGETEIACAARELAEEAGLAASRFEKIISYYPAIGFCTEVLHIYLATGLSPCSGQPDEDELITGTRTLSLTELGKMVESGQVNDAKTLLVYYMCLAKKIIL